MAEENSGGPVAKTLPRAARLPVQNPGFWSIWKLLGRPQDWEVEDVPFVDDNLQHKVYDIRFFGNSLGICFRPIWPGVGELWRPTTIQWWALHLRTLGFARRVRKAALKARSARPSSGGSHPTPPPPEPTKGSS